MFERLLTIVPAANAWRQPRMVIVGAGFGGLAAKIPPASFRRRNLGNLAPIDRKRALADFGRITLSGGAAWWIWGAVHIIFFWSGWATACRSSSAGCDPI
jgi:NADH dehydrogenase FAD-containing subunit